MITIKDPALGNYGVVEDYQGFKVVDSKGTTVVKINSFEEALRFIAQRLTLESDLTLTLGAYTKLRKEIYEKIVAAQETIEEPQSSTQQIIEFGESAHV